MTVQAGIRLRDLCDELAAVGLAMPNLGDINAQSIAGAISTATHGTGAGLGNLATTIVGMELVDGSGNVVTCDDAATRPDLLRVARVGVGALGIVTKVTIQCVPAFDLHAVETIDVLDDVLDDFAGFSHERRARRVLLDARYPALPGEAQPPHHRTCPPAVAARLRARQVRRRERWRSRLVCRVGRRFPAHGAAARQARRVGRVRA